MSTQIKRLKQNGNDFVPITLAEAVVVNTSTIPGLTKLGITTLDKVLQTTLTQVGTNVLNIDTLNSTVTAINTALQNKQDKLTAGTGITISSSGVISVSSSSSGFSYKIVTQLPTASASCENIVYLLPNSQAVDGNIFLEYICVKKDSNYIWEQIGSVSTNIDLSGYVTTTDFNVFKSISLTASDVTTSAGVSVTVDYDIPSTLYDE